MSHPSSKIERHPNRKAIETALLAGISHREVSARYGVSVFCIGRYVKRVIRPALLGKQPAKNVVDRDAIVADLKDMKSQVHAVVQAGGTAGIVRKRLADYDRIIDQAEKAAEFGACASLINSETTRLRLLAELSGELQQRPPNTAQVLIVMPGGGSLDAITEAEAIDVEAEQIDGPPATPATWVPSRTH